MAQTAAECMAEYEKASNGHDLTSVLSLVEEEAVYFFSDESVHRGRRAIERVLRHNFDLIQGESYSIDNVTWLAESDNVAACVYDYTWYGTIEGKAASGHGRGTSVLRRGDRDWKVVHEHLSRGKYKT